MVNNFINTHKMNSHLPPQTIEMQKKREAWLTHDIVNLIFFVIFAVAATYYVISGFFSAFSTM